MKILYGVVGEGMGHAIRSRVVLDHLSAEGHEVQVMASQRACDYLAKHFEAVRRIHGFHIVYEKNRVRKGKTFWANVRDGIAALPDHIKVYFELIEAFQPEVVVSDFESWTYLYAKLHRIPVLSVDNMQVINRCTHAQEIIDEDRAGFEIARGFVKTKLPSCDHYLVATFFHPPIRKDRTTLYPPILRPEILTAEVSSGEHLLVYQTAEGNERLLRALRYSAVECRIYGMRRDIEVDQVEGNLRYRPFSEAGFIEDLATARAVVAAGGFTLMSECVALHKPMLSMPIAGQFEQTINALYLEREGFGRYARTGEGGELAGFLEDVPRCEEKLSQYGQDGNTRLFQGLDQQLDRMAAGV